MSTPVNPEIAEALFRGYTPILRSPTSLLGGMLYMRHEAFTPSICPLHPCLSNIKKLQITLGRQRGWWGWGVQLLSHSSYSHQKGDLAAV